MALCSSAYNPVNSFTKHVYDDRELQRDRSVSKRNGAAREGFRRAVYNENTQLANDFSQFNNDAHVLLPSYSGMQQLQLGGEHSFLGDPRDDEAFSWSSEFQRTQTRPVNPSTSRNPQFTRQVDQILSGANVTQSHPQYHQRSSSPRLLSSRFATLPKQASELRQTALSQFSSSEKSLENLDWETVFKSIEPVARVEIERPDGSWSQGLVETSQDPPIMLITEEAKPQTNSLLMTRSTEYTFQDENPFDQVLNPFDEGMEIISNDGNLSFAALAFESACRLDPTHLEAWRMLGSVQAENEREEAAIQALKEAQKLDLGDLDIMMRLAASYTNEGYDNLAYENLERWLRTKYPLIPITEIDSEIVLPKDPRPLQRIKESYIQAAQLSMTTGNFDPDVQIGLGILLFSEESYQMAADCFAAAIHATDPATSSAQSRLHLLWNRYGACLGNVGQYEAAIEAYEMALAIRPNFVRARCNLGLVYYNKNEVVLGARNTLQALEAHKAAESKTRTDILKIVKVGTSHGRLEEMMHGGEPASIYDALRKCCNAMCRWDLAEAVGPTMDLRKFQKELDGLGR